MRITPGLSLLLSCMFCLAGCTTPRALTDKELADSGAAYWKGLQKAAGEASAPMPLDRALALALQNNLEFRMHALEAAVATGNRQIASMSMLPSLTAQAGYRDRNNNLASSSENVFTGTTSLVPSVSSQRRSDSESLTLGWNVLDFGLQYVRARQYGQQALIAQEERRKSIQNISRDVVFYWWMAKGYDEIQPEIESTRKELEDALRNANSLAQLRLNNPIDFLEYNKALFLIMKRLDRLLLDMNQARSELARLLGLPAGVALQLQDSPVPLDTVALPDATLAQWQMAALMYRPEMREALYRARISREEAASFWLGLMPALQLGYGLNRDSNKYLVNSQWQEFSTQLSWNLMRLATIPAGRKLQKLNSELAQDQAKLQATAVLSQVTMAVSAVRFSNHSSCISRNLAKVDSDRLSIIDAKASAAVIDRLTLIRAKVDNLLLRAEEATDRADYQRARATLLASVGIGIVPDSLKGHDIDGVMEEMRSWWKDGMSPQLKRILDGSAQALPLEWGHGAGTSALDEMAMRKWLTGEPAIPPATGDGDLCF